MLSGQGVQRLTAPPEEEKAAVPAPAQPDVEFVAPDYGHSTPGEFTEGRYYDRPTTANQLQEHPSTCMFGAPKAEFLDLANSDHLTRYAYFEGQRLLSSPSDRVIVFDRQWVPTTGTWRVLVAYTPMKYRALHNH
jgi:hypothetical protein